MAMVLYHKAITSIFLLLMTTTLIYAQDSGPVIYNIEEETELGTTIGNLITNTNMDQTIGFEEASRLNFKIVSKQPKTDLDYITVDESSGIVRINEFIDREDICPLQDECQLHYDVVVGPSEYFRIIKITLNIIDLNDNSPTFPSPDFTLPISEMTALGTLFAVPSPEDLDGGVFGIQQHELVSDTRVFEMKVREIDKGRFDIRLQLIDTLDREQIDEYELKIVVRDGGTPPREGTLNVHIEVEDSNDNEPVFDPASYEIDVTENVGVGTTIARVRAHDMDIGPNGRVRYTFSTQTRDDYGDIFAINTHTGDVYIIGDLDFEERDLYVLTVQAHDQGAGSLTSQTNIVVHVDDVNDKPPEVSINTLNPSGAEILENLEAGTFVAHLSVTDNDQGEGGVFSCSIRTDDFQISNIAPDQYNIFSRRTFDREERDIYEFPIVCEDKGTPRLVSFKTMVVRVGDANDNAPQFYPPSVDISVVENLHPGAFILQMNATDKDVGKNARIVYRLGGEDSEMVLINERSGVITAKRLFDHEQHRELNFVVYAEDKGNPPMMSSATVHIDILDEDDEPPRFEKDTYKFTVYENTNPGTFVGEIIAHDADSFQYNEFRYELDPFLSPTDLFQLNPRTGELITIGSLNREKVAIYHLTATATSTINPSQSDECTIVIEIGDLNDNTPVFQFPLIGHNNTVSLNSHAPAGKTVAVLRAFDSDINNNADLMYTIISGNNDNTFSIDSSSGHILLYKDVSSLTDTTYKLIVEVKDKGDPQLSDVSTLYVNIVNSSAAPVVKTNERSVLQSGTLTIALALTAGALLVFILIAIAVVLFCRKHKRNTSQSQQDAKECQKMLAHNGSQDQSPVSKDYDGNGVTVIDMRHEKNGIKPPIENGEEKIPLTVDLLSNHPIVKQQNGTAEQNGYVNKFSTFRHQHNGSNHLNGYNTQYSRTLSPSRDYSNSARDYANSRHYHKNGKPAHQSSVVSGEYMHYDLVDSDV